MQTTIPYNTNSVIFWIDPSEKFVIRDKNLNVSSIQDRISGNQVSQSDIGSRPAWSSNSLAGLPALIFSGHSLKLSLPKNIVLSGTRIPFSITLVAKRNISFAGTFLSIGSSSNSNPEMGIKSSSPTLSNFFRLDDSGLSDSVSTIDTGGIHVYTFIYDGTNLIARIDGIQTGKISIANTNGHFTADQIVIGSDTDAISSKHNYVGSIGQVVMSYGAAPNTDIENLFVAQYGVSSSNTFDISTRSSMRLWLDPRQASNPIMIPNRAVSGNFITPLGTGPTFSSTKLNGGPCLVWDGTVERRLQATIAGSFSGNPHATIIAACNFDDTGTIGDHLIPFNSAVNNADTSGHNNMACGFFQQSPDSAFGELFDGAGGLTFPEFDSSSPIGPVVLTMLVDPTGQTVSIRINGTQQATASSAGLVSLTAQTLAVIGGTSDGQDTFFGTRTISQGQIGTLFVFDELLSGATLSSYEQFAAAINFIPFF